MAGRRDTRKISASNMFTHFSLLMQTEYNKACTNNLGIRPSQNDTHTLSSKKTNISLG